MKSKDLPYFDRTLEGHVTVGEGPTKLGGYDLGLQP
jgi:hypothetical protein